MVSITFYNNTSNVTLTKITAYAPLPLPAGLNFSGTTVGPGQSVVLSTTTASIYGVFISFTVSIKNGGTITSGPDFWVRINTPSAPYKGAGQWQGTAPAGIVYYDWQSTSNPTTDGSVILANESAKLARRGLLMRGENPANVNAAKREAEQKREQEAPAPADRRFRRF
ncbi:hypothetical protein Dda_3796 [Drechslerella dactyloides]|uniref:Uncharacterized protein n=1 Tax=Drechslerella dactyloides TaxID=74499 RepID=A0AAD6NK87_DREDA|nr:hypothetical protein Dda_3796 [Drechslerella dactyloides]